ncbi:hypothetical protein, partial [Thermogutta sp.]|uniref:hypothetical protein n=1 Tax=Thermogutta sp. TaxID=1962930 RepID=UPI0025CBF91E
NLCRVKNQRFLGHSQLLNALRTETVPPSVRSSHPYRWTIFPGNEPTSPCARRPQLPGPDRNSRPGTDRAITCGQPTVLPDAPSSWQAADRGSPF